MSMIGEFIDISLKRVDAVNSSHRHFLGRSAGNAVYYDHGIRRTSSFHIERNRTIQ